MVVCNLPHRNHIKTPKPTPTSREPLSVLALNSRHHFDGFQGNAFKYLSCHQQYSKSAPGVRHFLKGICVPSPNRAVSRVFGSISINGVSTHMSHILCHREGEYYCTVCGYIASKKIIHLRRPCPGPNNRTAHGQLTLDQVKLGFTPAKRAGTLVNPSRAVKSKAATSAKDK